MKYEQWCSYLIVSFNSILFVCLASTYISITSCIFSYIDFFFYCMFFIFKGFLNDSVTKCIVALRLTVIVKVSTCMPVGSHSDKFPCSGKGKCITKPDKVRWTYQDLCVMWKVHANINTGVLWVCIYLDVMK